MARKLAIGNTIQTKVAAALAAADGREQTFEFALTCDRLASDVLAEEIKRNDVSVSDFMRKITRGWAGQKLVLEEDDTPAEFSADAFNELLSIAGLPAVCMQAYCRDILAKDAKAKN